MSSQVFAPFEHYLWIWIIFGSSFNETLFSFSCTIFDITHLVVCIFCCFTCFHYSLWCSIHCCDLSIFLFCSNIAFTWIFLMFSIVPISFYVATPFLLLSATGLPILHVEVFHLLFWLLISGFFYQNWPITCCCIFIVLPIKFCFFYYLKQVILYFCFFWVYDS